MNSQQRRFARRHGPVSKSFQSTRIRDLEDFGSRFRDQWRESESALEFTAYGLIVIAAWAWWVVIR